MFAFEKSILYEINNTDELKDEEDWYCVKIGTIIPGGCQQEICKDIAECPYAPEEIEL